MWFDVQAALKQIESDSRCDTRDTATNDTKTAQNRAGVADVADVATLVTSENTPDIDAFEERAAICEYDGGLYRAKAEVLAAQCQGYSNVIAFRAAQHRRASDE
jgi:hypothetical protein